LAIDARLRYLISTQTLFGPKGRGRGQDTRRFPAPKRFADIFRIVETRPLRARRQELRRLKQPGAEFRPPARPGRKSRLQVFVVLRLPSRASAGRLPRLAPLGLGAAELDGNLIGLEPHELAE
jgi:hypothetical protein